MLVRNVTFVMQVKYFLLVAFIVLGQARTVKRSGIPDLYNYYPSYDEEPIEIQDRSNYEYDAYSPVYEEYPMEDEESIRSILEHEANSAVNKLQKLQDKKKAAR